MIILLLFYCRQLIKDEFNGAANLLSEATQLPIPSPSSDLEKLVSNSQNDEKTVKNDVTTDDDKMVIGYEKVVYEGLGEIEIPQQNNSTNSTTSKFLDFDSEGKPIGKKNVENVNFVTRFLSAHKNGCRVAKFSPNGKQIMKKKKKRKMMEK